MIVRLELIHSVRIEGNSLDPLGSIELWFKHQQSSPFLNISEIIADRFLYHVFITLTTNRPTSFTGKRFYGCQESLSYNNPAFQSKGACQYYDRLMIINEALLTRKKPV